MWFNCVRLVAGGCYAVVLLLLCVACAALGDCVLIVLLLRVFDLCMLLFVVVA